MLRTVKARAGHQRPNNRIHGQDWTYRASCKGYHGLTRTLHRYRIRPFNQDGQFLSNGHTLAEFWAGIIHLLGFDLPSSASSS